MNIKLLSLVVILSGALLLGGCGSGAPNDSASGGSGTTAATDEGLTGKINIDGSTTVYPIVSTLGEDFGASNKGVEITVNKAGTGSGYKKFVAGEVDIWTASRPIEAKEIAGLAEAKIDYVEIPIAYDGVSVIVNPENAFAKNLTVDELQKAWAKESKVETWDQINPAFPKEKITFYGPTDNHGTYEYFTEAINGKKNDIRAGYQPNQEYTAIVSSVAGDKSAIAFVGFNYFEQNRDKVKALEIGGVAPSTDNIANGTYTPLSRPLFIYVSKKALDRPEVKKFVEFALGDGGKAAVEEASYVLLPSELIDAIKRRVEAGTVGTVFGSFKPGMKILDLYK